MRTQLSRCAVKQCCVALVLLTVITVRQAYLQHAAWYYLLLLWLPLILWTSLQLRRKPVQKQTRHNIHNNN